MTGEADYVPLPKHAGISQGFASVGEMFEPLSEDPPRTEALRRSSLGGRGTGVLVRLNDDDLAALDAICADSGKTRPEVLRLGLTALTIGASR